MRERGLKQEFYRKPEAKEESFPVRERGLKPLYCEEILPNDTSFPVRERGLKHLSHTFLYKSCLVVPRAGTWIETLVNSKASPACGVVLVWYKKS